MPFFENAIELDTYLVSDYPQVVEVAEYIFKKIFELDVRRSKTKNEEYKSKESLKIILINLVIAYESDVAVQYSRRKQNYTKKSRYGKLYFKYDRVIAIINCLIELGYIDNWTGFFDRSKNFGRQSRMAATSGLILLFEEYNVLDIDHIGKLPPEQDDLIQMRDKDGNNIPYPELKKKESMTEDLIRYNDFISRHKVSFDLTDKTQVNIHFLKVLLRKKVNTGVIKIQFYKTDGFIKFEVKDETLYGYEIYGRKHIIWDGPGSERTKNCLNSSHKLRHSKYKNYYNQYINKIYHKQYDNISNNSNTSLHKDISLSNTSMTGTFFENDEELQTLDIENTTTVKPKLQKRPLSDYGIYSLFFESNYQYLHRVFNIYADQAGRFYGAVHLNMPKEVRKCISIDGEPACELDFKAHHIRMLYHESEIDYREDPYEKLCEGDLSQRPVYKIVSLISINAGDEAEAVKGIRKQLFTHGIPFDLTDKSIRPCIDKFKEVHKPIANYLNTGQWRYLQYKDSRITNRILMRLTKEGIPCLPIHDSYIVPAKFEDLLYETMVEAYNKEMYGFNPVITKEF